MDRFSAKKIKPLTQWTQVANYLEQWVRLIARLIYDLVYWGMIKVLISMKRSGTTTVTNKETQEKK